MRQTAGSTETNGKHNVILDATYCNRPRQSAVHPSRLQRLDDALIPALDGWHPVPLAPVPDRVVRGSPIALLSATRRPNPRFPQRLRRHRADAASHRALRGVGIAMPPRLPVRPGMPLSREGAAWRIPPAGPLADGARRTGTDHQAEVLAATARLGDQCGDFATCRIRSGDRQRPPVRIRAAT